MINDFIVDNSFKNFRNNREQRNWTIIGFGMDLDFGMEKEVEEYKRFNPNDPTIKTKALLT